MSAAAALNNLVHMGPRPPRPSAKRSSKSSVLLRRLGRVVPVGLWQLPESARPALAKPFMVERRRPAQGRYHYFPRCSARRAHKTCIARREARGAGASKRKAMPAKITGAMSAMAPNGASGARGGRALPT